MRRVGGLFDRPELSLSSDEGVERAGDSEAGGRETPYEAVPPPEGSEPLQDLPNDAAERIQYGAETSGVPAGRMLVRGAKDTSDGPLKDNRLVTSTVRRSRATWAYWASCRPES